MPDPIQTSVTPAPRAVNSGPRVLGPGMHGRDVAAVQLRLAGLGYPGGNSGTMDPQLDAAVKAFQTSQGLKADGLVGPLTRAALANPRAVQLATDGLQLSRPVPPKPTPVDPVVNYGPEPTPPVVSKPKRLPYEVAQPDMSQIKASDLQISAQSRTHYAEGQATIDTRYPIKKGSYEVILDYPQHASGEAAINHLYVYDREHDRVMARYVSNGGRNGWTRGHDLEIDNVVVRPTWQPTKNELKESSEYAPDGPGPTGSMGLVKLHLSGAEYIHGVEDADLVDGVASEDPGAIDDLGKAVSHGCWNMSNPNAVELVERFGIGETFDAKGAGHLSHTQVHIMGDAPEDRQMIKHLEARMKQEGLGDRLPSDGTDLLEQDYKTTKRYLRDHSYLDTAGTARPADQWYVDLWKARRDAE